MEELLNFTPPLIDKDIGEAEAVQLLLHNQAVELIPLHLTPHSIPNSKLVAGIQATPIPPAGQSLLEVLNGQHSIWYGLIEQKRHALRRLDAVSRVRYGEVGGLLKEVENCPPYSLAAWRVIQPTGGANPGPAPKKARKGDKGQGNGKGKQRGKQVQH